MVRNGLERVGEDWKGVGKHWLRNAHCIVMNHKGGVLFTTETLSGNMVPKQHNLKAVGPCVLNCKVSDEFNKRAAECRQKHVAKNTG